MAFCERIFFGLVGITLAALAGCESKAGTNPPAETKIITSAGDSCGARSGAFASCPAGFELVEGGYHLVSWDQRALSGCGRW